MTRSLAGRTVLVTRPAGLAARLAELLGARGCDTVLLPAIDILPPDDPAALREVISRLEQFDIAIFVSPTAVVQAVAAVGGARNWPARLGFAAIGSGTARALREAGFSGVLAPEGRADSEALAALPEMAAVKNRRVVIFRGQGGRESLRQALEARGARVEYAECYRRARPQIDVSPLVARWQHHGIDAVCITSAQGLENLLALLGPAASDLVRATPVFVPHPRIGEAARQLGVAQVVVAGQTDEALADALAGFFAKV